MNYTVKTPAGLFVMTAPIGVIQEVFCLHRNAIERIERELRQNPGCKVPVHFNGRRPLGALERITVEPEHAAEVSALQAAAVDTWKREGKLPRRQDTCECGRINCAYPECPANSQHAWPWEPVS